MRRRRAPPSILSGLGFSTADQARPCSEFSGGWRMRVALAAMLFAEPDLLLLDEPTNYLDLEGTLWLEEHLARYPHTVIVISHDRDLLDTAVDQILSLEASKLTLYRGGYSDFERLRGERLMLDQKMARSRKRSASTCRPSSTASAPRPPRRARRSRASRCWRSWSRSPRWSTDEVRPITFPAPDKLLSPPIIALDDVVGRLRARQAGAARA